MRDFEEIARLAKYSLSLPNFLSGILNAHQSVIAEDLADLSNWFKARSELVRNLEDFSEIVLVLDPGLEAVEISDLFAECRQLDQRGVTPETFSVVALYRNLADFGIRDFKINRRSAVTSSLESPGSPSPAKGVSKLMKFRF